MDGQAVAAAGGVHGERLTASLTRPPQEGVAAWEEERRPSKYADALEQLPPSRQIPMDPKQVQRAGGDRRRRQAWPSACCRC